MTSLSVAVLALSLFAVSSVLGADSQFDGLGMNMGNLSRLSSAKTRSISPENFTGEKGKGGMATDGPAQRGCPRAGPGLEDLALRPHRARTDLHPGRHRGPRRDPADLDDPHRPLACSASCASTGTTRQSPRSSARSAISSPAAGASTPSSPRWPSASTPAAPSTATGRCPSARRCRITLTNIGDESR